MIVCGESEGESDDMVPLFVRIHIAPVRIRIFRFTTHLLGSSWSRT